MNERGRTSASFLIAVLVVLAVAGGYVAVTYLRPDPYARSERVVRDARRELSDEVREFQRSGEEVAHAAKQKGKDPAVAIEEAANKARKQIDSVIRESRDRLAALDVELRTQRNRLDRIEARAQEARDMITEHAEELKAKAAGG